MTTVASSGVHTERGSASYLIVHRKLPWKFSIRYDARLGFRDWNVLAARIQAPQLSATPVQTNMPFPVDTGIPIVPSLEEKQQLLEAKDGVPHLERLIELMSAGRPNAVAYPNICDNLQALKIQRKIYRKTQSQKSEFCDQLLRRFLQLP